MEVSFSRWSHQPPGDVEGMGMVGDSPWRAVVNLGLLQERQSCFQERTCVQGCVGVGQQDWVSPSTGQGADSSLGDRGTGCQGHKRYREYRWEVPPNFQVKGILQRSRGLKEMISQRQKRKGLSDSGVVGVEVRRLWFLPAGGPVLQGRVLLQLLRWERRVTRWCFPWVSLSWH